MSVDRVADEVKVNVTYVSGCPAAHDYSQDDEECNLSEQGNNSDGYGQYVLDQVPRDLNLHETIGQVESAIILPNTNVLSAHLRQDYIIPLPFSSTCSCQCCRFSKVR